MHLTHTLPIFINENSEILILGSFPSVKSREVMFYYGHPQNRFFSVLARLFDEDAPITVEQRKAFLKRHKIALYDVIEECDIEGSADSSIKNVIPIDIVSILERFPNIRIIGITGNTARYYFDKFLLKKVGDIKVVYLPSTSPANAKMGLDVLEEKYQALLNKTFN